MREALQMVAVKTRSELKRIVPHEHPLLDLDGYSEEITDHRAPFDQHHEITGHMVVDAHTAVNTGESWLIGVPALTDAFAQNIVTGVLSSLGRETVEIDPAMVNGAKGVKIYSEMDHKRE